MFIAHWKQGLSTQESDDIILLYDFLLELKLAEEILSRLSGS